MKTRLLQSCIACFILVFAFDAYSKAEVITVVDQDSVLINNNVELQCPITKVTMETIVGGGIFGGVVATQTTNFWVITGGTVAAAAVTNLLRDCTVTSEEVIHKYNNCGINAADQKVCRESQRKMATFVWESGGTIAKWPLHDVISTPLGGCEMTQKNENADLEVRRFLVV